MTSGLPLCYIGSMKHFLYTLSLLVCLLPVQAKIDTQQLLGGLLNLGGQMVVEHTQNQQNGAQDINFGDKLVLTLRGATDTLLESYKEEGREYAKEVGDIISQKMLENEKVNNTLDSVRYLCWGVVSYLTVVTLLMLLLLLRLRVLYARLMRAVSANKN